MAPMHDDLGDRMKSQYEGRTRYLLPRRTYTLLRADGRAFHTYTKNLPRPFDDGLTDDMNATAIALCESIDGAQLAFVQSDEISVLITDFATPETNAWFDGNIQKMVSIGASIATVAFNAARAARGPLPDPKHWAQFDARVFTVPDPIEVENYFIWRQQDATRNSILMVAQAHYTAAQIHGHNTAELRKMLASDKGVTWEELPARFRLGRVVLRRERVSDVEFVDKRTGEPRKVEGVVRRSWEAEAAPSFTADRAFLRQHIPSPQAPAEPPADPAG